MFNTCMPGPTSSLEVLRLHIGRTRGPDAVQAVAGLDLADIDVLAEALLGSLPRPADHVPTHEVWPLVNARASLMSAGGRSFADSPASAGLNLMAAMNPRDVGKNTFSTSVLRALLYSHGLVLEDPLVMAAELHVTGAQSTRKLSRLFIQAAVTSLIEIEALLDARVIQTFFVPTQERALGSSLAAEMRTTLNSGQQLSVDEVWEAFEAGYVDGLNPPLRELWSRIRNGDRSPPLDLVRAGITASDAEVVRIFVKVVAHLRPSAVVDNTVEIVASALDDLRRLGSHHDVLCTSPLFARLLFLGTPDPVSQLRVRQLARTPVPSLDQLDVTDVVKIRVHDEAFALWRARLSSGLERAHRLRDELGPDVDVAAAVAETMEDARQQVLREVRSSKVLGRGGLVALIMGALGGTVSGLGRRRARRTTRAPLRDHPGARPGSRSIAALPNQGSFAVTTSSLTVPQTGRTPEPNSAVNSRTGTAATAMAADGPTFSDWCWSPRVWQVSAVMVGRLVAPWTSGTTPKRMICTRHA